LDHYALTDMFLCIVWIFSSSYSASNFQTTKTGYTKHLFPSIDFCCCVH